MGMIIIMEARADLSLSAQQLPARYQRPIKPFQIGKAPCQLTAILLPTQVSKVHLTILPQIYSQAMSIHFQPRELRLTSILLRVLLHLEGFTQGSKLIFMGQQDC